MVKHVARVVSNRLPYFDKLLERKHSLKTLFVALPYPYNNHLQFQKHHPFAYRAGGLSPGCPSAAAAEARTVHARFRRRGWAPVRSRTRLRVCSVSLM